MPPPPPRAPRVLEPKPAVVLDEDMYTSSLEAIIERDYFPELPKMANQLEWLQAVNSGDPRAIQRAQRNIARRRAGIVTPGPAGAGVGVTPGLTLQTPGTGAWGGGATPGTAVLRTPAMTPMAHGMGPDATPGPGASAPFPPSAAASAPLAAAAAVPPVSLDTFLAQYTSEDNASFKAILEEDNRRKRAKHAHHLERKDTRDPAVRQALLEGPPPEERRNDDYGTSGQGTMTLMAAPEPPLNRLFYGGQQPAVPLSAKEVAERGMGPPKQINRAGTRLHAAGEQPQQQRRGGGMRPGGGGSVAGTPMQLPHGAPVPGGAGGTTGYSPMATPSLMDAMATPIMTWGDIESTPLRLDAEDMPITLDADGAGLQFCVQAQPPREAAAHQLAAAKAGVGLSNSSGSGLPGGRRGGGGGRRGGGSRTPLLTSMRRSQQRPGGAGATPLAAMSPAARQLAARVKGSGATPQTPAWGSAAAAAAELVSGELDSQLRASYKAGGAAKAGRTPTPVCRATGVAMLSLHSTTIPAPLAAQAAASAAAFMAAAAAGGAGRRSQAGGVAHGAGAKSVTDDLLKL